MANTVKTEGCMVEVSAIDSDYAPAEVWRLHSIKFYPGATDDIVKIFNDDAAGIESCRLLSADGEPRIEYMGGERYSPFLDFSASTLTAGSKVVFIKKTTK